jgi:hypothetical protein
MKLYRMSVGAVLSAYPLFANDFLKNLPADTWYRVPNSAMRSVCASDSFPEISPYGPNGCRMVMEAWGGGAYDPAGKRLWIWGGGHGDYYGNELYAFDIETLSWKRITDPSPVTRLSQDPMPDGNPVSRHTYDGLAFITHVNRFFGYGGSMAGSGSGTEVTWVFDPAAKTWSKRDPSGNENRPASDCCNFTGEYDPQSKKVFIRDPHWLCAYDFDRNAWTHVMAWDRIWEAMKTVVDTRRHLLFSAGAGAFLVYDIQADKDVSSQWSTTGDTALIGGHAIGMAYDPKADALVGWMGGGAYVLDLQTKVWTRKSGIGAPAHALQTGTYGRFRYVPDDNVFILANGVDSSVYFYKHGVGAGLPVPGKIAAPRGPKPVSVELSGTRVILIRPEGATDALGKIYGGEK